MDKIQPTSRPLQLGQIAILSILSAVFLFTAPEVWNYRPDSGVYIGSALSLVEEGRYWFNGNPNLLYYPGMSLLLWVPVSLWGLDFGALHLVSATFAVTTLWLVRWYFTPQRYGWLGLALPLLLAMNHLVVSQAQTVLSDLPFLGISIGALLIWRRYLEEHSLSLLVACALLVAFAPMMRFQGLFLVAAFGTAILVQIYQTRTRGPRNIVGLSVIAGMTLVPFLLWTLRNYAMFTPDTYNMAGSYFFGTKGLSISSSDWGVAEWIDAAWKIPFYQALTLFSGLTNSFLNEMQSLLPIEIAAGSIILLLLLGAYPWIRGSNLMEVVYVTVSITFIIKRAFEGNDLYIPDRYWIPMLPFVLLIAGNGISTLIQFSPGAYAKKIVILASALLAFAISSVGLIHLIGAVSLDERSKIVAKMEASTRVADYVRKHTDKATVLLTTDWGVAPLLTQRKSYQVARSKCAKDSLSIIVEKKPEYLVAMPGVLRSNLALDMAEQFPELFLRELETGSLETGDRAAVYRISFDKVSEALAAFDCG